jgi:hypothetical protein
MIALPITVPQASEGSDISVVTPGLDGLMAVGV